MIKRLGFGFVFAFLIAVFAATILTAMPSTTVYDGVVSQLKLIKIGVAAPFSVASMAPEPEHIYNGVKMAVDEVNLAGGIQGLSIAVVKGDDQANRNKALKVARMFGRDPAVMAVVGHYNSSATLAGALMYNRYRLVAISPASTSPRISQAGRYIFRVVPSDAFQGRRLAQFAFTSLGARRVVVVFDNDDYGRGLSYFFIREFTSLGGKVVARIPYQRGITNLYVELTNVKNSNPDLLFVAGIPITSAETFIAADSVGLRRIKKLGGDGCIPQSFKKLAGRHAEGVYHTEFVDPNTQAYKTFVARYRAKYGFEPSAWAAFAYDAAKLVLTALQENGVGRENVRRYLAVVGRAIPPYRGVTGTISFDSRGDAIRKIYIAQVRRGKSVIIAR